MQAILNSENHGIAVQRRGAPKDRTARPQRPVFQELNSQNGTTPLPSPS